MLNEIITTNRINAANSTRGTVTYFRRFDMQVQTGAEQLSQRALAPRDDDQSARRDAGGWGRRSRSAAAVTPTGRSKRTRSRSFDRCGWSLGADATGPLTDTLVAELRKRGHDVAVYGALADGSQAWASIGRAVGEAVAGGQAAFGVVCCWTGTGISIAANKVPACAPLVR